jgi:hypothetical protein
MKYQYQERIPKNFRLSRFTVSELDALSKDLKTNKTAIVELAIARFGKEIELKKK